LHKQGLHYENWRFELPRHGKTIVVRNQRSEKILRKFTWNGESLRMIESGNQEFQFTERADFAVARVRRRSP